MTTLPNAGRVPSALFTSTREHCVTEKICQAVTKRRVASQRRHGVAQSGAGSSGVPSP